MSSPVQKLKYNQSPELLLYSGKTTSLMKKPEKSLTTPLKSIRKEKKQQTSKYKTLTPQK